MLVWPKTVNIVNAVHLSELMNKDYLTIYTDDSLKKVIETYQATNLDTLPVVDRDENLVGVFPRRRLYKALLESNSLDDPCTDYVVYSPSVNYAENAFNQSLLEKLKSSPVGNAPVLDASGKMVGMIGKLEYLRETVNVFRQALSFLEAVFQSIYEGLVVVDNEGYILSINQSAEKMFKVDYENIRGQYITDVFPEIDFTRFPYQKKGCTRFKEVIRGVSVVTGLVPVIGNGVQIGTNITFRDMSDVERLSQKLESTQEMQTILNGVLNASSDGVFVTEKSGHIKYVNEMASQLVKVPAKNITGRPLKDFIPTIGYKQVADSGPAEVDVCQIKNDYCIVSHMPIKENMNNGKPIGVVSTVYCSQNKLPEEIAKKWYLLRQQVRYYCNELEKKESEEKSFDKIFTKNPTLMRLKKEAQHIAKSSSTVLLTGESGVGKDAFARAIFYASPRAKMPFVQVNCAAIPETLLESEFFGYNSGSFTGASKNGKPGYFEQAHLGAIFLDEIGEMPLSIQAKVLKVIQDKTFMRVGGTVAQEVDVRIIAATNRNLQEAIANGTFREDLYYRLNVIELNIPPLRAHPEDITPLAFRFIEKYNLVLGADVIGIAPDAEAALLQYYWPGNIRELENAIERAVNYAWEGEIKLEHLPTHIGQVPYNDIAPTSYRAAIDNIDKELLLDALKITNGNKASAAKLLKLSRSGFYKKLIKHGIL